mmetsp:Transcript_51758/g.160527  ORF Transcript_51758/g.160527 Transcript_51758/m.160527 type:complete len:206 (-) Transcript_51758:998-1615(-)
MWSALLLHARRASAECFSSQTESQSASLELPTTCTMSTARTNSKKPKKTTAQSSVRKPARMPFTSRASSLKALSLSTLTSFVSRAKRKRRTTVRFLKSTTLPTSVRTRSKTAMSTTTVSNQSQYLSGPKKKTQQPCTSSFMPSSMMKIRVKLDSHHCHTSEPDSTSVLTPMTTALRRITRPMKGSRYFMILSLASVLPPVCLAGS